MLTGDVRHDIVALLEFRRERRRLGREVLDQPSPAQEEEPIAQLEQRGEEVPGTIAATLLPRRIHLGDDQGPAAVREVLRGPTQDEQLGPFHIDLPEIGRQSFAWAQESVQRHELTFVSGNHHVRKDLRQLVRPGQRAELEPAVGDVNDCRLLLLGHPEGHGEDRRLDIDGVLDVGAHRHVGGPDRLEGDDLPGHARGPSEEQRDPADVGADIETDISLADDPGIDLLLEGVRPRESAQVEQDLGGLFRACRMPMASLPGCNGTLGPNAIRGDGREPFIVL